jgi:hypothetical protein
VEPVAVNDIRRWTQAMRNPHPLFYDAEYAAGSRFGQIVAPQSFTIVTNAGQGFRPAGQGTIPNSHQLFGGDEWWFYGPRIVPGDTMRVVQMMSGYRVVETGFAGPTVIQKGDNHYTNQRGEPVALQRSAAIRYIASAARERASLLDQDEHEWTDEELAGIFKERQAYVDSVRALGHDPRTFESVEVGEELVVKVVGPHSHVSFATEWRAYTMNLWHAMQTTEFVGKNDLGLTPQMTTFTENAEWDLEFADGAYFGASRGHLFDKYARWMVKSAEVVYDVSSFVVVVQAVMAWTVSGSVTSSLVVVSMAWARARTLSPR